jgi:hypothetical protein
MGPGLDVCRSLDICLIVFYFSGTFKYSGLSPTLLIRLSLVFLQPCPCGRDIWQSSSLCPTLSRSIRLRYLFPFAQSLLSFAHTRNLVRARCLPSAQFFLYCDWRFLRCWTATLSRELTSLGTAIRATIRTIARRRRACEILAHTLTN